MLPDGKFEAGVEVNKGLVSQRSDWFSVQLSSKMPKRWRHELLWDNATVTVSPQVQPNLISGVSTSVAEGSWSVGDVSSPAGTQRQRLVCNTNTRAESPHRRQINFSSSCFHDDSPVSGRGQVLYRQLSPQPSPSVQQHSCWLMLAASNLQVPPSRL